MVEIRSWRFIINRAFDEKAGQECCGSSKQKKDCLCRRSSSLDASNKVTNAKHDRGTDEDDDERENYRNPDNIRHIRRWLWKVCLCRDLFFIGSG